MGNKATPVGRAWCFMTTEIGWSEIGIILLISQWWDLGKMTDFNLPVQILFQPRFWIEIRAQFPSKSGLESPGWKWDSMIFPGFCQMGPSSRNKCHDYHRSTLAPQTCAATLTSPQASETIPSLYVWILPTLVRSSHDRQETTLTTSTTLLYTVPVGRTGVIEHEEDQ